MAKSSLAKRTIVPDSWRAAQTDPTLLLRMAADAKRAGERAARITELRGGIRDPETGKKLSQERLAAEIHVSSRSVQNWERGGELDDQNRKVLAEYFTSQHGRIITEDFIEYGVTKRERTPELFLNGNGPSFEETVLARLAVIEDLIRAATAANSARVAEAMQLLEDRLPPNAESQRRRPA